MDREGEAISWHVLDLLNKKKLLKDKPVKRVVFNAITKKAVLEAMANPRQIDETLVNAYLARRALDYLVGFNLSPVLWRKLPGARSAGRVQSVALRKHHRVAFSGLRECSSILPEGIDRFRFLAHIPDEAQQIEPGLPNGRLAVCATKPATN